MRKLTYFIATSTDGFVSRVDGGLDDFAFDGEHVSDLLAEYPETIPTHLRAGLKLSDDNHHFDTVLMGRRTYEVGVAIGVTSPYQHLEQFVFSRSLDSSQYPDITLVDDGAVAVVRELKRAGGQDIWLCGGPELATDLIGEIDNLIVKVNPFLMGAGKPLFVSPLTKLNLRLVDRRDYSNGFSLVHFAIEHASSESTRESNDVEHGRVE